MPDGSVDVVISFETIEHIVDYHQFMQEIKRVLKPGGILVLSTPNYLGEIYKNVYHVSNFTTIHLIDLFKQYYSDYQIFYQGKHQFVLPGR
jgi:2-polyprenyl-3-methyl-5-hydroxy-6-metoxy-1,4-benzoquinol methylase